jgi:fermentation-respiration switch protein FrsA (DUF1100 family)
MSDEIEEEDVDLEDEETDDTDLVLDDDVADDVERAVLGASTMAALDFAVDLPQDEPLGVIIFSPWKPDVSRAAQVKRPTLVVFHADDLGSAPFVEPLFDALTSSPAKERVGLAGGIRTDECGGYHLFRGIDTELVDAIADFIEKHNATQR